VQRSRYWHVALTARYYGRTARRYLRSERGEGLLPLLTRIDRHYVPKGLVGVIAAVELSVDHGDL
jgi:succinate-semialdehyde dehydrogenase/glutarate-semialdehyde dehydrogenase